MALRHRTFQLDDSFNQLPHYVHRWAISEAKFAGTSRSDFGRHPTALSLRVKDNSYVVEYRFDASLPVPRRGIEYEPVAAHRGVLEYVEFPSRLAQLSREYLEGGFTRLRYRLVPHVDDAFHLPLGSPFRPHGRWEKLPSSPLDPVLRARLVVDQSIVPYPFATILDRLSYTTYFDSLRVEYEARHV